MTMSAARMRQTPASTARLATQQAFALIGTTGRLRRSCEIVTVADPPDLRASVAGCPGPPAAHSGGYLCTGAHGRWLPSVTSSWSGFAGIAPARRGHYLYGSRARAWRAAG